MSKLILFWHRRDLRIDDNIGLAEARKINPQIVGIFCLDPNILNRDDVAPARVTYMIGCLQHLKQKYTEAGSQLLIILGKPEEAIPIVAKAVRAKGVYWNKDVEPYSRERDRLVEANLDNYKIVARSFWDQLLHSPTEIRTGSKKPYTVFTPFWKTWSRELKPSPVETFPADEATTGLTPEEEEAAWATGLLMELPTAKQLGFNWDNPLILEPGEAAALDKLEYFTYRAIYEYKEMRNYPNIEGTSKLSPALKFGAISIRKVWQAVMELMENARSIEAEENIETWLKELAWREFYQQVMYHFPELEKGPYREPWKNFPWENNEDLFQAWCQGRTGYPIIDAAMRQLNETGWMHNRCRMIVASFLTKDLIINWQWGEKYFMQKLIDGDLSANNGGWQWSASSGMDPKPLRIFNPASQAKKFDSEGEYIKQWVEELRSVDTGYIIKGKIPQEELEAVNYPAPIVDHSVQQRKFKALYKEQKAINN